MILKLLEFSIDLNKRQIGMRMRCGIGEYCLTHIYFPSKSFSFIPFSKVYEAKKLPEIIVELATPKQLENLCKFTAIKVDIT